MKKLCCLLLALVLAVSLAVPAGADGDVLMMYDAERATDVGGAFLASIDYDYFTEGKAGYGCQSIEGYLEFFMDSYTYNGRYFDISGYDYIEFDMFSWEPLVCDFNFAVIPNLVAHHGNDFYMEELYLPAETFVHFKIPIADLVVYSQENLEPYDDWRQNQTNEGWQADDLHYGGSCLNAVGRLRWQLAFARVADPYEEPFEDVEERVYPEYMYIVFDNVVATKNGAGSPSTYQTWDVVKQEMLDADQNQQPDQPVVTPDDVPVTKLGDLDENEKVDAKDALEVLKYSVNKVQFTDTQKLAGEVTGDGNINAKDALEILKYSVKKITQFPIENKG